MSGARLHLSSCHASDDVIHVVGMDQTRFKSVWKKHTCFGLQKHRNEPMGTNPAFDYNTASTFQFPIPKYGADLLTEAHLVIALPHIWSGIRHKDGKYCPYEFQWIRNLGCNIIREIRIKIGSILVLRLDGVYMQSIIEREYTDSKRRQLYEMLGNVSELYDPAGYNGGKYPNVDPTDVEKDSTEFFRCEPSIRGRLLSIPVMAWFSHAAFQSIPLCSMQHETMVVEVCRTCGSARPLHFALTL